MRTIARCGIASALAIAALLFAPKVSQAAPFEPASTDWEGCSRLIELARKELGPSHVEVVDEIDYEHLGPADGLLIIHPEVTFDLDEMSSFMKLGGRLAIADDFGTGDALLDRFRIERATWTSVPIRMLHGNAQLPVAVPASGHPIVADVGQVVLNHPSTVHHPELSSLLRIPLRGGENGPDVALAGQVGEGRLVAIGDPSIFINSMMRYSGNQTLARNLVNYLLDTGGEHRVREAKLTIVHGRFKEHGTLGGGVTGSLRDRLRGLSSAVDNVRREGFGAIASRVVALSIAIAAAVWVIIRAALRSKIPRPRYAAANPEAPDVAKGVDDPRLAQLMQPAGSRLWSSGPAISSAGVTVVHDALDAAIAARDDLKSISRVDAVQKLAVEAGLDASETKQVEKAYVRLKGEVVGQVGGRRAALSKRDASLFGRVLAPVADSLRALR